MMVDRDTRASISALPHKRTGLRVICVLGTNSYGDPARGETHEFINFLPALRDAGHEVRLVDSFIRRPGEDFATLNLRLLNETVFFRPDVILLVLMSYEIWIETLDLIRAFSPAVTINWGTDDSWKFDQVSRFFAPHIDYHVTTYGPARDRAHSLGLNNVLQSQWGVSTSRLRPPVASSDCHFDVSFVGQMYGDRRAWIDELCRRGIKVAVFGHGSERGPISSSEVADVYQRSRISLNFADPGHRTVTRPRNGQIKARIFEVTGAGGFLLTENVDGMSDYFESGREIDVFSDVDGLAEKIRFYLGRPELRDEIACAGHKRARTEHTYPHRFSCLLDEAMEHLPAKRRQVPWTLAANMLEECVARHRDKRVIGPLRSLLERPAQAAFGMQRGPRAARRFTFELSWRLVGERTFSAVGLPGRLFYGES